MPALDDAIATMDETLGNHSTLTASPRSDSEGAEIIVKGRVKFTEQYGEILRALDTDERLKARPELKAEFAERLKERRHTLASHQVKWRMSDIAENLDQYLAEAQPIARGNREFINWAKAALRGL